MLTKLYFLLNNIYNASRKCKSNVLQKRLHNPRRTWMQPAPWKTIILAVVGMSRPYRLHSKASVRLPLWKENDFPAWLQSYTRYGDADILNARINARIYDTAIRRTLLTATGSNIASKIATKSLQIETWLLLKAHRKSPRPIQPYYRRFLPRTV